MKPVKAILALILMCFMAQTSLAQIKVVTGGNVVLSRKTDPSAWVLVGETEQNFNKLYYPGRFNVKAVNALGLTVQHESYTNNFFDWTWVSSGRSNYPNSKHWITIAGNKHTFFATTMGTVYGMSYLKASDVNIKENVNEVTNALSLITQLRGVSYDYKPASFCGDSCTSDMLQVAATDRMHYGFISQEVEAVIPNIVADVETGIGHTTKALDYDEIIPLLVEAIKEQQNQIVLLTAQIDICCNNLNPAFQHMEDSINETSSFGKRSLKNATTKKQLGAILYQNNPNPFTQETTIRYNTPANCTNSSIRVYNLSGSELQAYPLTQSGEGSIKVDGSKLGAGSYLYTLICNGKEVDTKKMILTR